MIYKRLIQVSQNNDLSGFEKLFLALCDRTRLRLLSLMADGPVSVGYLAGNLGESQPKTSRHLAYLRGAGLVSTAREGKWIYYGLEKDLDPAIEDILTATLRSVSGRAAKNVSNYPTEPVSPSAATSVPELQPSLSEWAPNEIEVHLL